MNNYGLLRVSAATPIVHVAQPHKNAEQILALACDAHDMGASLVVFPELSLSGCTCGDLFFSSELLEQVEDAAARLIQSSRKLDCILAFGLPLRHKGRLFNCALLCKSGMIVGIVPKSCTSASGDLSDGRWFESADYLPDEPQLISFAGHDEVLFGRKLIFQASEILFGVEIGKDLYSPVPMSTELAVAGAQLIVNLAAEPEFIGCDERRKRAITALSDRLCCAYLYSGCGFGESTQDYVWGGASLICENGQTIAEMRLFRQDAHLLTADVDIEKIENLRAKNRVFESYEINENIFTVEAGYAAATDFCENLYREVDARPYLPADYATTMPALVNALCTRMSHIGCKKAVIGVSGGLDSTLALLVAANAFERLGLPLKNIIGVTMPGFGTSKRTRGNADILMEELGITAREISIVTATRQHFADLGHDESIHDLTYENSQARERTQILMDLAGKEGGIVIGTGDLSELALGWCTYNGDHMSMYSVNAGIPKTLVRELVQAAADQIDCPASLSAVLRDIADTPISPELVPTDENGEIQQKTEDLVGPYELHDFFIHNYLNYGYNREKLSLYAQVAFAGEYSEETIERWLDNFCRRFRSQQFKRSCLPDGPKIESISLSPRGGWKMPSDL